QLTVDYFYRDSSGTETMLRDANVETAIYDHQGLLLQNGSAVTSANGFFDIPRLFADYVGRIKIVVTTISPDGIITDSSLRFVGNEVGVFGVLQHASTGTITITPLWEREAEVEVDVMNGGFAAPSLAGIRGPFRAVFRNSAGKKFSKD